MLKLDQATKRIIADAFTPIDIFITDTRQVIHSCRSDLFFNDNDEFSFLMLRE